MSVTAEVTTSQAWKDWVSVLGAIVAVAAALISYFSYRATVRRDEKGEQRDLNAQGDSELKLYEIVAKAEKDAVDFNLKIMLSSDDEIEALKDAHPAYIQYMLNSYDIGCQRYLDGKLDKERFKKTYRQRIAQLYGNQLYLPFLTSGTYKYSALDKVNKELNDQEG